MSSIRSEETEIVGNLITVGKTVKNDDQLDRIWSLISSELRKVATSENGWEALFQHPEDGRYWELYFPHGEMHGGGPPALRVLSVNAASAKYRLKASSDKNK